MSLLPAVSSLQGHERPLTQVKYNREGDLLVSCAKDLQPCLWFAEDGKRIGTYEGHNGAVWTCVISLESDRLITSSADQTVRLWDLPTGVELHQIRMSEPCRASDLSVGEQLLAFTTDSFMGSPPSIHLVDIDLKAGSASAPKASIVCPKGRVTRVFFTDCNRVIISSHDGGWVRLCAVAVRGCASGACAYCGYHPIHHLEGAVRALLASLPPGAHRLLPAHTAPLPTTSRHTPNARCALRRLSLL